jgi:transcriptional regulator with XRE-family HTH domain
MQASHGYSEPMPGDPAAAAAVDGNADATASVSATLGARIREYRRQAGLSVRGLAAKSGVSASLISQIERGRSTPSVSTLLSIASELGLPMGELFDGIYSAPGGSPSAGLASPLQKGADRSAITLATGVRWERLNPPEPGVDFTYVVYPVGAESCEPHALRQHNGREYVYVLSGTLAVQIGFDEYEAAPGDSIAFDSSRPHRLWTVGDEPVVAIWMVLGGS